MQIQSRNKFFTILGSTGDLGSQFAKYLINKKYPVQLIIRKGHIDKLQRRIERNKFDDSVKVFSVDTLIDKNLLESIVISSKIIYDLAGLVGLSFRSKAYPNILLINSFFPGLLNEINKKYKRPIVYASTQRIKKIKKGDEADVWAKNMCSELRRFIQKGAEFSESEALFFLSGLLKKNPVPFGFNIYELSKYVGERMLMYDKTSVILRVSGCYGPGCSTRRTIGRLVLAKITGQKIKERDEIRDYIYIDDLNEIFEKLVKLKIKKTIIEYCCSGTSVGKKYIIEKISKEVPDGKGVLEVSEEFGLEIFKPSGKWFRNFIERKPTNLDTGLSKVIHRNQKKFSTKNMDATRERLLAFYDSVRQKTDEQGIDPEEIQKIKDKFFTFENNRWIADEAFWKPTGIVFGYPFSPDLVKKFDSLRLKILKEFGTNSEKFWLPDINNLHSTIVNYSHYSEVGMRIITMPKPELNTAARVVSKYSPIEVMYKGVLITNNGSILVMGFVDNEDLFNLRKELTTTIDGITQQPQNLVYVKLAQILTDIPYEQTEKINRLYSNIDLGTYRFTSVQTAYKTPLIFHKQ